MNRRRESNAGYAYKRTFYDADYADVNSVGGRVGLTTAIGARALLSAGLVYEHLYQCNAQDRTAAIDFSGSDRQSKRLVHAQHVMMSRGGRKLFGPLDLTLSPGDKLGLLGGNGSGKSTLLKLLTGELPPDSGTLKRADGLKVVTFDQHREQLDLSLPLRRALCDAGDTVQFKGSAIHIASWAERFLFSKAQLDVPLSRLSGGEQSRVLIARLMLKPADVLLLDEPTNDLDINSLEILETSMMEFPGALVLVTHDRYLLDRVSKNILALDGKGHARYYADLAQWEDAQGETEPAPPPVVAEPPSKATPRTTPASPRGLSAKELKEIKQVEAQIRAAETALAKARAALEDPSIATNATELLARQAAIATAQLDHDALISRWENLETRRQDQ